MYLFKFFQNQYGQFLGIQTNRRFVKLIFKMKITDKLSHLIYGSKRKPHYLNYVLDKKS